MSRGVTDKDLGDPTRIRLVRSRREHKTACYRLDDAHIERLLADGFEHVEERV